MTIINTNSISGINSITAQGSSGVAFYDSSGSSERLRITSGGRILKGLTTARDNLANNASGVSAEFQIEGTSFTASTLSVIRNSNDANDGGIILGKTRATSTGGNTVVQAGDDLGALIFAGSDGTTLQFGAEILAEVQSGVGNDDLPTDLIFKTNGGTTDTTERLRITSDGDVGIGDAAPNNNYGTNLSVHSTATDGARLKISDGTTGKGNLDGLDIISTGGVAYFINRENADMSFSNQGGERLRITSAGISQFTATGRVATFTGNGVEVNNSLGSNVFIGTQSGTEGKIGTVNNANMALFANNDYSKRAELQTSGSFALNDGDLILANGHGINFGSTTPDGDGTVFSETLDDYEEGIWVPTNYTGGSVTLYRGYYIKIGRQVTIFFSGTLSSGTGASFTATLPFVGSQSGTTGTAAGVEAHGNSMLHSANPPANTYNASVYCWGTVCSIYWNIDQGGWSQATGTQLNGGSIQFTATYVAV